MSMRKLIALLTALCLAVCCLGGAVAEEEKEDVIEDLLRYFLGISDEEEEPAPEGEVVSPEEYVEGADEYVYEDPADEEEIEVEDHVEVNDLAVTPGLSEDWLNILLLGSDARGDTKFLRTDTMIVLSVNSKTNEAKMTSIMRDTYVELPGYRNKARLNESFYRGAGQLAMRTINHNFELNIQHYVVINFYGVASIIEQLGGIDLRLTRGEAYAINYYLEKNGSRMKYDTKGNDNREKLTLPKGNKEEEMEERHLDGMQALMYARLRTGMKERTGDFWRTNRQRYLLETLMKKVLAGIDLNKLGNLVQIAYPYVQTNIPAGTLLQMAIGVISQGDLMGKLERGEPMIEQLSIPMENHYSYDQVNGASVITMTTQQWSDSKDRIHYFIYGESN